MGKWKTSFFTFKKIWVEFGRVLDQPWLAFLKIGSEFAILCWKTTNGAVQNPYRLGFFCHWSLLSTLSSLFSPPALSRFDLGMASPKSEPIIGHLENFAFRNFVSRKKNWILLPGNLFVGNFRPTVWVMIRWGRVHLWSLLGKTWLATRRKSFLSPMTLQYQLSTNHTSTCKLHGERCTGPSGWLKSWPWGIGGPGYIGPRALRSRTYKLKARLWYFH